jgi:hypothetical protein
MSFNYPGVYSYFKSLFEIGNWIEILALFDEEGRKEG